MTNEQAKDLLDNLIGMVEDNQNNDYDEALKLAIKTLEKQIPKEPKRNNTIASKFFHKTSCYTCPTCGNGLLTK